MIYVKIRYPSANSHSARGQLARAGLNRVWNCLRVLPRPGGEKTMQQKNDTDEPQLIHNRIFHHTSPHISLSPCLHNHDLPLDTLILILISIHHLRLLSIHRSIPQNPFDNHTLRQLIHLLEILLRDAEQSSSQFRDPPSRSGFRPYSILVHHLLEEGSVGKDAPSQKRGVEWDVYPFQWHISSSTPQLQIRDIGAVEWCRAQQGQFRLLFSQTDNRLLIPLLDHGTPLRRWERCISFHNRQHNSLFLNLITDIAQDF